MEPGRELDALVAEEVMGWAMTNRKLGTGLRHLNKHGDRRGMRSERIPAYSTDISAAWEVVEKLRQNHLLVSVKGLNEAGWWCEISPFEGMPTEPDRNTDTAPHAICLAALEAVGAA